MSNAGTTTKLQKLWQGLSEGGFDKSEALRGFRELSADEQTDLIERLKSRVGAGADFAEGTERARLQTLRQRVLADLKTLREELD
jgi:hypothetical protein